MPGSPDFSGTRLLHGTDTVIAAQTVNLNAGQSITLPLAVVTRPGYIIQANPAFSAASTMPFIELIIRWFDSTGTVQIGSIDWIVSGSATGNNATFGQGPCRGGSFTLQIINRDTVNAASISLSVYETSHHITRDDWRASFFNGAFPGYTSAPGANMPQDVLLKSALINVPAASSTNYLLPLYSGQAFLTWVAGGGAGANINMSISEARANSGPIYSQLSIPSGGSPVIAVPVTLPRYPCILTAGNAGTVNTTLAITLTAQEYAS